MHRLTSNETVFDDQVPDEIFGDDGQDWFFLTGAIEVYDPNLARDDTTAGDAPSDGHSHAGPVIVHQPPALEGFEFVDSLDKISDRQQNRSASHVDPACR